TPSSWPDSNASAGEPSASGGTTNAAAAIVVTAARIPGRPAEPRRPAPDGTVVAAWPDDGAASESAVGVHAVEEDVDEEVVRQHAGEPEDRQVGGAAPLPAAGGAGVQVGRVDDPDHEREDLLRVPAPRPAPGVLGPDGPGDDREGPQHEADGVEPERQPLELGRVRHRLPYLRPAATAGSAGGRPGRRAGADEFPVGDLGSLLLDLPKLGALLDELQDGQGRRHGQDAGGDSGNGDVDDQPVAVQDGLDAVGADVEHRDGDAEEQEGRPED